MQIWRNSLTDQSGAVASYRRALALDRSITISELYQAAGADFSFDGTSLRQSVDLILKIISDLEKEIN